jgi:hypothetical protein
VIEESRFSCQRFSPALACGASIAPLRMTWLLIDYAFIIFYPEFFFKESFRKAGGKYFTDSSRSQKASGL